MYVEHPNDFLRVLVVFHEIQRENRWPPWWSVDGRVGFGGRRNPDNESIGDRRGHLNSLSGHVGNMFYSSFDEAGTRLRRGISRRRNGEGGYENVHSPSRRQGSSRRWSTLDAPRARLHGFPDDPPRPPSGTHGTHGTRGTPDPKCRAVGPTFPANWDKRVAITQ